jgi:hypothetical protein
MTFELNSDRDLEERVRSITGYSDTVDEMPRHELDDIIRNCKLEISNEVGSDNFFVDTGLQQALIYLTALRCKQRVENVIVTSFELGNQSVDLEDASDADQIQFSRWATAVDEGIRASNAQTVRKPSNTSDYIP